MTRIVIVYESMFGNTHTVADAIAAGLAAAGADATVASVDEAAEAGAAEADLLVVGGPTHAHGMTSSPSRASAVEMAEKDEDIHLDPHAEGEGLRDWLGDLPRVSDRLAVAFDTRVDAPAALTGRASKGIRRRLHHHGYDELVEPESFLVDKANHLLPGEVDRAREWGSGLAVHLAEHRGVAR